MRFSTSASSVALLSLVSSISLSACSTTSIAEQSPTPVQQTTPIEAPRIVPQQERDKAQQLEAEGPTETLGIESLEVLANIDLSNELEQLEGYSLRAREIVVAPGGQVAVHQHESRPGIAYILEGEMVEHRNDQEAPVIRSTGEVSIEKTGIVHWWKNESDRNSRALVVDIVPEEQ